MSYHADSDALLDVSESAQLSGVVRAWTGMVLRSRLGSTQTLSPTEFKAIYR